MCRRLVEVVVTFYGTGPKISCSRTANFPRIEHTVVETISRPAAPVCRGPTMPHDRTRRLRGRSSHARNGEVPSDVDCWVIQISASVDIVV